MDLRRLAPRIGVGGATVWFTAVWAATVDRGNVFSFAAVWTGWHRWLVPALAGAVYAREAV